MTYLTILNSNWYNFQVRRQELPEEQEKELKQTIHEIKNIIAQTTLCFNGTKWSNLQNHIDSLQSASKNEPENFRVKKSFQPRTSIEFDETYPGWKNKFSDDLPMGKTKFLLKTLPGGHSEYSSTFTASSYGNFGLEFESKDCFDLSSGLGKIFATTSDNELREFIWEVQFFKFSSYMTLSII